MTAQAFNILNSTVSQLALSRFKEPTEIQKLVIPRILNDENVLVIAGTGVGKTESSMLPLFSKIMDRKDKPISLLYITPMKSLNRDLFDRLVWWCNQLELDISVRHGDTTSHERSLQVEHPPHILITTPEQIQGMLTGKRMQEHLKNIKYIVIDELHELISKRGVQLTIGIQRLKKLCGDPQIIALSATVGSPKVAAEFIFGGKDYEIVKAISEKNIDLKVECPSPTAEDKMLAEKIFIGDTVAARLRRILEIIKSSKSVLTFTNTREAAEVLSSRLRMLDSELAHEVHHSSLSKDVRMQAEMNFKNEQLKTLICTSSLELGIDIGTIDVVIQYMSPRQASKLVQRIGRSGHRLGLTSKGYIITNDEDDAFESVVVARKAMHGELEPLKIYKKPLDVLAHQIIGLTVVDYEYNIKDAYKLIKQASPYKDLTEEEFNRTINMLEQIGMLYKDGDKIKRKRRAFEYYFENLSTIPDNKTYKVIDMTANAFVGTLDENFVIEHGEADSTFIVKGRPWRVVSVEEGKIYVEPTDAIESSVPAWEGELIPVPFDVAQEVGEVRRKIAQSLEKGEDAEAELMKKYPVDSQTAKKMIKLVKEQMKKYPVADDKTIVYEKYKEYLVINSCFGSKVNETLARYISALLAAEYGSVIQTKTDPYRIIFKDVDVDDIKKIIKEFHKEDLEFVLNKAMSKSSIFRGRFMNVAKRFGVMSRRSEFGKINLDRLIDTYWKSPVFDETMNELFLEKLDVEKAIEIFDKLNSGKIKQVETDGLSPIGSLGFKNELRDIARPDRPEAEIFKIFKERLLGTKTRIVCMSCGEYSQAGYVKNMPEEPRCTKCSSKLIGVTRYADTEMLKIVKKRVDGTELTGEEQKKWEGVYQTSNLVIVYGKKAIFVLAGRGVGPVNATRILAKPNLTEEELLKNILKAEREFVKNKKYWS